MMVLLFLLLSPGQFLFQSACASEESGGTTIFFCSSESSVNNFKSLKMELDQYLSEFGHYQFQPFRDRAVFEQYVREKRRGFLLLSAWHYSLIHEDYALKALLVGARGGKKYQKMVLTAKTELSAPLLQKIDPLASACSTQYTRSVLLEMLQQKEMAESLTILSVPKDIDALVSVGFGMSKSALTTESTLDQLKTINPVLYNQIKVVAQGKESLSMVLAFPKNFEPISLELLNIVKEMPLSPKGKKIMEMIGLDGWRELDASDIQKLESK